MAASKYNITVEQGATTDFEGQWNDSNGVAIDLTGYTARMQIKDGFLDDSATTYRTLTSNIGDVYAKASGSSFLSLSGSNLTTSVTSGSIGIYIGHEDSTVFLTGSSYYYDLELTSGEKRTRLLEGFVIIKKQVTA